MSPARSTLQTTMQFAAMTSSMNVNVTLRHDCLTLEQSTPFTILDINVAYLKIIRLFGYKDIGYCKIICKKIKAYELFRTTSNFWQDDWKNPAFWENMADDA
jgi:hypothetical protein